MAEVRSLLNRARELAEAVSIQHPVDGYVDEVGVARIRERLVERRPSSPGNKLDIVGTVVLHTTELQVLDESEQDEKSDAMARRGTREDRQVAKRRGHGSRYANVVAVQIAQRYRRAMRCE